MRFRHRLVVYTTLVLAGSTVATTQKQPPPTRGASGDHIIVDPASITWRPIPPGWADGPPPAGYSLGQSEVAIIDGDPTKEGVPFVIRFRSAPGTQLPPHWHPIDEHITILSGVWCVGMGDRFDEHACRDLPAGSYLVIPKGMSHFAVAKGSVVQLHGIGPFKIHWVK